MDVKVGIIMGSDSDLPVMSKAAEILDELQVPYELTIVSAHRTPDRLCENSRGEGAESNYRRRRRRSPSAGHDGGDDGASCHWCAGSDKGPRRCGFTVFHCSDASGNPCGNRGDQRRSECGTSGCEDSGSRGSGTFTAIKRLR